MPDLLVKDVEPEVVEALANRAANNGRPLQIELKLILEQAARTTMADARELAARIRHSLGGSVYSNSVELLAEERGR